MTPSTHVEIPVKPEAEQPSKPQTLTSGAPEIRPAVSRSAGQIKYKAAGELFQSSMIENNHIKSSSKTVDFLIALTVNAVILAGPILAGLIYTDTLNLKQFETTFLMAPPPPPPPPPAPAAPLVKAAPAHRVFENAGKLIAPSVVPKTSRTSKKRRCHRTSKEVEWQEEYPAELPADRWVGSAWWSDRWVHTRWQPQSRQRVVDREHRSASAEGERATDSLCESIQDIHRWRDRPIAGSSDRGSHHRRTRRRSGSEIVSGPPLLIQSALDAVGNGSMNPPT